uniref:Glycoside hydrolase family 28 protein n=1 Tax=Solanum tuberosum TaxID=4113 RepID=M1AWV5_SOLTU
MAGQIETPRQPFSGRYIQHRTAVRLKLAQVINRRSKSVSIQRRSVADSAEIRQRCSVCSATYGGVLDGFPFVYFVPAVNITERR